MEMKGITCKIPLELHNRISDEIRETESTMGKFIEMIINEHYIKEENSMSTLSTGPRPNRICSSRPLPVPVKPPLRICAESKRCGIRPEVCRAFIWCKVLRLVK